MDYCGLWVNGYMLEGAGYCSRLREDGGNELRLTRDFVIVSPPATAKAGVYARLPFHYLVFLFALSLRDGF